LVVAPAALHSLAFYSGPRNHDGIQLEPQNPDESTKTIKVVNQMIDDLNQLNLTGNDRYPPEVLAHTWHDDMIWYGPAGIGATYTIPRYQQQHSYPFREGLKDKVYNGHVCRYAEGNYACFFGWPNLSHAPSGGFMGLPAVFGRICEWWMFIVVAVITWQRIGC
jgi:hypothetical protein